MGFCSLQHLRHPRSTVREPSLPATFRLQGLVTLLTVSSLESRAGFVSHRQRSWDSPFGGFPFRKVSAAFQPWKNPHTVGSAVSLPPEGVAAEASDRPEERRFLGPCLPKVPGDWKGFKPPTAGASHGVCPSRACHESLGLDFSGPPLTRFTGSGDYSPNSPAPQSVNRLSLRSAQHAPKYAPAEATLVGFLHLPDPEHSGTPASGL
jgi:hypothetical protein